METRHGLCCAFKVLTGAATLRTGTVPVRVEAHRDRLVAVKRGEVPWPEVDAWRKELHCDFERALAETSLPERPDYEAANRFSSKPGWGWRSTENSDSDVAKRLAIS